MKEELAVLQGLFPNKEAQRVELLLWGLGNYTHTYLHPALILVKGSCKFKSEDQSNWGDSAMNGSTWLTSLGWFNIQAWYEVCLSYFKMLWPALGYPDILTPCQIDLTPWGRGRSSDSHTLPIGCPNAIMLKKVFIDGEKWIICTGGTHRSLFLFCCVTHPDRAVCLVYLLMQQLGKANP